MEQFSLSGKNVLVTGASGGLGSTLVKGMAEMGVHLAISSRSSSGLKKLVCRLPKETQIIPIPEDLSLPGRAQKLAEKAIKALGHIDILFNNAGIGYFALMEEKASDQNIRHLFEVNTFSPLSLIRALLPHMKLRKTGRIINIVSCAGRVPVPSEGVYGGSKTALAVMCNTMRLELEPLGIGIINIYPGTIDTLFEENALRENKRPGLSPDDHFGASKLNISNKIIDAAMGPPGEIWLDRGSKWLTTISLNFPKISDSRLAPMRDKVLDHCALTKPFEKRRWRLLKLELSATNDLNAMYGIWQDTRQEAKRSKLMSNKIWEAVRLNLPEIQAIEFIVGDEPLEQNRLADWIGVAKSAGCETGVQSNAVNMTKQISQKIINAGVDRITFFMIGATIDIYAAGAKNVSFEKVCENIKTIISLRVGNVPIISIDFILTSTNIHQTEEMIKLAASLGVEKVSFKQYNVIQGSFRKQSGFFYSKGSIKKQQVAKVLKRAQRLSKKMKIDFTAFSQPPDEQPVCDQDPRNSLFICHDGMVCPCINLAAGGTVFFGGKKVNMPAVHYGCVAEENLVDLWNTRACLFYRERFHDRVRAYDSTLGRSSFEASWPKLQEALQAARDSMPKPPDGCAICPQLYDI